MGERSGDLVCECGGTPPGVLACGAAAAAGGIAAALRSGAAAAEPRGMPAMPSHTTSCRRFTIRPTRASAPRPSYAQPEVRTNFGTGTLAVCNFHFHVLLARPPPVHAGGFGR